MGQAKAIFRGKVAGIKSGLHLGGEGSEGGRGSLFCGQMIMKTNSMTGEKSAPPRGDDAHLK